MMRRVKLLCSLIILLAGRGAQAVSYPLPPEGSRLVGSPLTITVPPANTQPLEAFAAQYGQGLSNMLEANPGWMSICRSRALRWWCHSRLFCRTPCVRVLL